MKRISTSIISLLLFSALCRAGDVPVLTSQDFTKAKVITRNGRVVLQATLSDRAFIQMKESPVGEKVDLMSGGKVIATPVIRAPMGRQIEIDALNRTEAEDFARLINH